MKILAIADIEEPVLYEETKQQKLGDIDLIISCGDLSRDYLSYISTIYKAPLFFVRGNHDTKLLSDGPIGENLHGKIVKYKNIRMLGFEGVPRYTQRPAVQFQQHEIDLLVFQSYLKTFLWGRPEIIVTHAPPKGEEICIGDKKDYAHRGVSAYYHLITRLKPKFFLYGHNHSMFNLHYDHKYRYFYDPQNSSNQKLPWITQIGPTTVIMIIGYCILNY